jgi:hypothetical protein
MASLGLSRRLARRTLEIGGERIQLAWHGSNHSPDNIYIHFPDHDTLMLVDIVLPGWVPFYGINLSEDVPGYMDAPATAWRPADGDQKPRRSLTMIAVTRPGVITLLMMRMLFTPLGTP